jgi:hypothetical protein
MGDSVNFVGVATAEPEEATVACETASVGGGPAAVVGLVPAAGLAAGLAAVVPLPAGLVAVGAAPPPPHAVTAPAAARAAVSLRN